MENIKDAPWIRNAEATGYDREPRFPRCPICDEECDEIYKNQDGEVVGCDNCIEAYSAWEWQEEQT